MRLWTGKEQSQSGPRRRDRHYSYDESVDEAAQLLEEEPVDMEEAVPAETNEPVETVEESDASVSPAFESGTPERDRPEE